jgi:serine/threonine protein kinase
VKIGKAISHYRILGKLGAGGMGEVYLAQETIATEYVEGVTLRDRISSQDQLKLSEALEIAAPVASALAATHAAGIVHRDIKPDNLMLRKDGFVKVLDFGLAKLTAPTGSETDSEAETRTRVNTEPGVVMGTVAYMSPEQARGLRVAQTRDLRT